MHVVKSFLYSSQVVDKTIWPPWDEETFAKLVSLHSEPLLNALLAVLPNVMPRNEKPVAQSLGPIMVHLNRL